MLSKRKTILIGGAMVIAPLLVLAQNPSNIKRDVRQEIRENKQDVRKEIKEERQGLKMDLRERHETLKRDVQDKRRILESEVKAKREALRQELKNMSPDDRLLERRAFHEEVRIKREAFREEVRDKREAFRADKKERIDAFKKRVGEIRAERIEAFFDQMVKKFESAIDRLNDFDDRIDSRLDKFEDAGKDVLSQRALLDKARAAVGAAEDVLDAAKGEFNKMSLSENPKVAFGEVKKLVKGVVAKVKEAHRALVDVVKSIKNLPDIATTTPQQ